MTPRKLTTQAEYAALAARWPEQATLLAPASRVLLPARARGASSACRSAISAWRVDSLTESKNFLASRMGLAVSSFMARLPTLTKRASLRSRVPWHSSQGDLFM